MQVFIAIGWREGVSFGADYSELLYVYAFTDPDQAMAFVEKAQGHTDDAVTRWEIVTETVATAQDTYARHRAWVEE
jgi:hypothetical protein